MHNFEIAWAFREMATLLEIKGESSFKALAYRKGADILEGLAYPVSTLNPSELVAVPGLGKGLAAVITELLETGQSQQLQALRAEIPLGIKQAIQLPGVGTKVAHKLLTHLQIESLEDLERAAKTKQIRVLPGLGPKVEVNIQRGIARLRAQAGQILLSEAKHLAAGFSDFLGKLGVEKVAAVGEIRRGEEMVSLLELVVVPGAAQDITDILANHPLLSGQLMAQAIAGQSILTAPLQVGINLIIYLVQDAEFIPALLYQTGSTAHWQRLVGIAKEQGYLLGPREFSLLEGGAASAAVQTFSLAQTSPAALTKAAAQTSLDVQTNTVAQNNAEAGIYQALGLPYIPAELREDQGEIEAAIQGQLPTLIELADIQGDLHLHSKWSDGVNTVSELVAAAQARGYSYLAVTDHSKSLVIARGVPEAKLMEQRQELAELNAQLDGFRVFSGIELDILADGRLDYPDEFLAEMDLVIGSIHSGFQQSGEKLTDRLLGAIQNPHVDIIAHPTGRVLGRRDPYAIDVQAVIEAAAKYHTALEINASPDRLDLKAEYCRLAKEHEVKLVINTDAHGVNAMGDMQYGVTMARKGWLTKPDILNAWSVEEVERYLRRHD